MNTNMLQPSKLLMVDEKGNQCELEGTITFDENDYESTDLESNSIASIVTNTYTINVSKLVKLTRKKLIKLLMSKGIQRNGANEIAKHILKKNGKYTMFDLLMW